MDRDFFRRGTRFQHQYGQLENDPIGNGTFQVKVPRRIDELHTAPCEIQEYGERRWYGERSAVVTPSGRLANTRGPDPDHAYMMGIPVPVSTKERKSGSAR